MPGVITIWWVHDIGRARTRAHAVAAPGRRHESVSMCGLRPPPNGWRGTRASERPLAEMLPRCQSCTAYLGHPR